MKRVFSVIFALLLVVVMVSCSNVAVDDSDGTGSVVINLGNSGRSVSGHFSSGDGTVTVLTKDDVTEWEVTLSTEDGILAYNKKVSAASSIRFNDVPLGVYHVYLKAYAGDVLIGEAQTENDSEKVQVRNSVVTEVTLKFCCLKYIFHTSTDEDTDNPFKYRIPLNPGNIMALDASDTIPVPNYMINSRTPSGKAFDYWALVGDTSGTEYHSGDAISLDGKTLPLEFVAQWKNDSSSNGGNGSQQDPQNGRSLDTDIGKFIKVDACSVSNSVGNSGAPFSSASTTPVEVGTFYMAETELTYEHWYEVYTWAVVNGYTFKKPGRQGYDGAPNAYGYNDDGGTPTNQQPVTNMYWSDAIVWCNAASEKYSLEPVYTKDGEVLKDATTIDNKAVPDFTPDLTKNGYRLPTEAEWETAARGGNPTAPEWLYAYSGVDDVNEVYLFAVNKNFPDPEGHAPDSVQNVKSTGNANSLGFYDMSGNVLEMCWDVYYNSSSSPIGRPRRGGSQNSASSYMLLNYRDCADSNSSFDGFRVVKNIPTGN